MARSSTPSRSAAASSTRPCASRSSASRASASANIGGSRGPRQPHRLGQLGLGVLPPAGAHEDAPQVETACGVDVERAGPLRDRLGGADPLRRPRELGRPAARHDRATAREHQRVGPGALPRQRRRHRLVQQAEPVLQAPGLHAQRPTAPPARTAPGPDRRPPGPPPMPARPAPPRPARRPAAAVVRAQQQRPTRAAARGPARPPAAPAARATRRRRRRCRGSPGGGSRGSWRRSPR